ncbi:phytanoyl-CoA dioxygenase family protein, partial [Burkholderia pseudomallei OS]|nr:phytanoyl-CoA dioxygenase family protein [Burkholderia pseudomallei OS]
MRYIKFAATIARRFSLRGMVASMSRTSVLQSFIDNNDADHPMSSLHPELIHTQVQTLRERGFVVAPGLVAPERCAQLKTIAERQLREAAQPLEFEADLRYPGAP